MTWNRIVGGALTALAASIALSWSTTLRAQSKLVSPTGLTNAYGFLNHAIPFGPFAGTSLQGEVFVQQIDEQLVGVPRVLQAMAFRHEYSVPHVAKAYTATVKVGDAATAATGISATFANNFKVGGSSTTVFRGTIHFPAQVVYPYAPSPFDAPVPFTTPFAHSGVDPLVWEVWITATTPITPMIHHEFGPNWNHLAGRIGAGCSAGGASFDTDGFTTALSTVSRFVNGPVSTPVALMVGSTNPTWHGLPLPVNLGFIGAPSCHLHVDALAFVATMSSPSGGATLSIPLAMSPGISGQRFRTQWVAVGANIVTSNGLDHSVPYDATAGRRWPQSRVFANNFGTTTPVTGLIQQFGLVTEWTF